MPFMRDVLTSATARCDRLQLEAQRAGSALACPFTCSDDFEAAVIRARRSAGAYRTAQSRRYSLVIITMLIVAAAAGYLLG